MQITYQQIQKLHHLITNATTVSNLPETTPEYKYDTEPDSPLPDVHYIHCILIQNWRIAIDFVILWPFLFFIKLFMQFLRDLHTNKDKNSTISSQTLPQCLAHPKTPKYKCDTEPDFPLLDVQSMISISILIQNWRPAIAFVILRLFLFFVKFLRNLYVIYITKDTLIDRKWILKTTFPNISSG